MMGRASEKETIGEVVKNGLCTGCGTCAGICPADAVEMVIERKKGIYLPVLREDTCTRCGLCLEGCPGHAVDFKQLNLGIFGKEPDDILVGNYLGCYTGYATDHDIRYNSSSGGLVTALLIFALEEGIIDGALVTGMKKERPLEPEPFIARTREEVVSAAGSKYCPVPANTALKEILEKEGRYAVVGLPCHLHGIRKAEMIDEKLRERIALHLGLFCSGTPGLRATEFLLRRRNTAADDITALHYRCEGWPGSMSLHLKDDSTKVIPYPAYWEGFERFFFPPRCRVCLDWYATLSDISFGDAWLPEVKRTDKAGTSMIISRTERAEKVLLQVLNDRKIELHAISASSVSQSQQGFERKRKQLKIAASVARILSRRVLAPDVECFPRPTVTDYVLAIRLRLGRLLAARSSLWWLLDVYCSLLRVGSRVKSRIRL